MRVAYVIPLPPVCVLRPQQPFLLFEPLVYSVFQLFRVLAVLVQLVELIGAVAFAPLPHELFQPLK